MNENYQYTQDWETETTATGGEEAYPATGQMNDFPVVQNNFVSPRAVKKLAASTELSEEMSRCRSLIARQSLMNLAVLSHAEEILTEMSATGAARYKLIVDAVAMADARMIAKFGGDGKW